MVLINFDLSCDLLWGYSMMLDQFCFTSVQSIISCVETSLQNLLKKMDLMCYMKKVNACTFIYMIIRIKVYAR